MSAARTRLDIPFGSIHVVARDGAIRGVFFDHEGRAAAARAIPIDDRDPLLALARAQLLEYFAGERMRFELPLEPDRGTTFEREVWRALAAVPFGARTSYASIGSSLGRPRALRAVGAANARNPLSIVVPCHRVVGIDGSLIGYSGGLAAKQWLLAHEARVASRLD